MVGAAGSFTIVMRTLDRSRRTPPRANYLRDTINHLVAQSGGTLPPGVHIVDSLPESASGGETWYYHELQALPALTPGVILPIQYHPTDRPLTNNQNALRALQIGVDAQTDWIVHLEDDIETIRDPFGAIDRWLTRHGDPAYPLFTFHTPYRETWQQHQKGREVWRYPVGAFYGNQGWAIRRAEAITLITHLAVRIPQWNSGQGFDLLIKEWARTVRPEATHFLASAPAFIQHVGQESSLHLGRFHQVPTWPGTGWAYRAAPRSREEDQIV